VLAEEVGRALAPVPFTSSVLLGTEALLLAASPDQQARLLPALVDGSALVVPALAEARPVAPTARPTATITDGRLSGIKLPVSDALAASWFIVDASAAEDGPDGWSWWLVRADAPGVSVQAVETVDLVRKHGRVTFENAPAERLGGAGAGAALIQRFLDMAGVLLAFEALGTAEAAMTMTVDYAKTRTAFGQAIGRYQAVKHRCADMYIKVTLARGHAYHGAWALASGAAELTQAAAGARVASLDALRLCAEETVELHGGIGFTWEHDAQLFYRRARLLGLTLGSRAFWTERLVRALEHRNAA
jgi:alkylation response protein AidB-like acyl-CoA dehydrogenase